ncbi:hypothetical protein DFP73DRAFT_202712 [Morchella snyderi]|nr:hypothetical protein DFP73DRAFT_202712 [Morchella snyderi]
MGLMPHPGQTQRLELRGGSLPRPTGARRSPAIHLCLRLPLPNQKCSIMAGKKSTRLPVLAVLRLRNPVRLLRTGCLCLLLRSGSSCSPAFLLGCSFFFLLCLCLLLPLPASTFWLPGPARSGPGLLLLSSAAGFLLYLLLDLHLPLPWLSLFPVSVSASASFFASFLPDRRLLDWIASAFVFLFLSGLAPSTATVFNLRWAGSLGGPAISHVILRGCGALQEVTGIAAPCCSFFSGVRGSSRTMNINSYPPALVHPYFDNYRRWAGGEAEPDCLSANMLLPCPAGPIHCRWRRAKMTEVGG